MLLPLASSKDVLKHTLTSRRPCIVLLCLALTFLYYAFPLHSSIQASLHTHGLAHNELLDVTSSLIQRLNQLAHNYKKDGVFNAHHLDLGPSVTLKFYTARLDKASRDAFVSSSSRQSLQKLQPIVASARSAIDLSSAAAWTPKQIPHKIITGVRHISEMSLEFAGWKLRNPDWPVQRFDWNAMDTWLETNLATPTESGLDKTVLLDIYNNLPRRNLKADLFRYLIIFLKGGVYADPDTCAVQPVSKWGNRGTTKDKTDFKILQLAAQAHDLTIRASNGSSQLPINDAPPAVIVAKETLTTREDREGGHIAQYAFASAPGHPIFLDLLQNIVEFSRGMEKIKSSGGSKFFNSEETDFTWTGAEVWSSAVWRYLWARWGFDSRRLHGINHPVRVGDVLILPAQAFRASSADPERQESPEACLWHGFYQH
ncbi:MAG: hypothetical protein Q9168_005858 [Polycauliona sp. 1 TL-2023]